MLVAGGGATHHYGRCHTFALHQRSHTAHLLERRCDEAAQRHYVGIQCLGLFHNHLAGHHHPEVNHFVAVATQHHGNNVFAYVVHVALDGGNHHSAGIMRSGGMLLCLDVWV